MGSKSRCYALAWDARDGCWKVKVVGRSLDGMDSTWEPIQNLLNNVPTLIHTFLGGLRTADAEKVRAELAREGGWVGSTARMSLVKYTQFTSHFELELGPKYATQAFLESISSS